LIKFDKPANLNGTELLDELAVAGIVLNKDTQIPLVDGNGDLWLDVKSSDKSKVEEVLASHNGTIIAPQPTAADKLAAAGLTVDDLKALLGLNG
jgi:hypothetical protein